MFGSNRDTPSETREDAASRGLTGSQGSLDEESEGALPLTGDDTNGVGTVGRPVISSSEGRNRDQTREVSSDGPPVVTAGILEDLLLESSASSCSSEDEEEGLIYADARDSHIVRQAIQEPELMVLDPELAAGALDESLRCPPQPWDNSEHAA